MFEEENEDGLGQAYRNYIAREVGRPEVLRDKKKFLAQHFDVRPPVFKFSPAFFMPALAAACVFMVFNHLQTQIREVEGPLAPIYGTAPAAMSSVAQPAGVMTTEIQPQAAQNPVANHKKPRVVVKRVSSSVGPTMVYQKLYRNVPVTVVWVFAGGKN